MEVGEGISGAYREHPGVILRQVVPDGGNVASSQGVRHGVPVRRHACRVVSGLGVHRSATSHRKRQSRHQKIRECNQGSAEAPQEAPKDAMTRDM